MLYELSPRPPTPGSLMEIVYLMTWRMRRDIDFQKERVVIQALLSQQGVEGEAVTKAFDDLRSAFFPYEKATRKNDLKAMREALEKEVARGPLLLTPLETPEFRKRSAGALKRGEEVLRKNEELRRAGIIQSLDPYEKARRRGRAR